MLFDDRHRKKKKRKKKTELFLIHSYISFRCILTQTEPRRCSRRRRKRADWANNSNEHNQMVKLSMSIALNVFILTTHWRIIMHALDEILIECSKGEVLFFPDIFHRKNVFIVHKHYNQILVDHLILFIFAVFLSTFMHSMYPMELDEIFEKQWNDRLWEFVRVTFTCTDDQFLR